MATAAVQNQPSSIIGNVVEPIKQAFTKTHDVETTMNYYKDPGDGSPPPPTYVGRPETYAKPTEVLNVTVHDISGKEGEYTLDKHGFQLHKHPSVEKDFIDDEKIAANYYPEVEQIIKDVTGASRVHIFDHTIRRQPKDVRTEDQTALLRGPVRRVHVDQSFDASLKRVKHHLPDDAEELLKGRVQIINVWRPIKPIYKDPLAIADGNSVPQSDLVVVPHIYPDRSGETYTVKANSAHKWYFKYGQKPEEVTLIKCFDTLEKEGVTRRSPHSAFENKAENDGYSRESIEVRTLVFGAKE